MTLYLGESGRAEEPHFPRGGTSMPSSNVKYVGLDVHKEAIVVAVRDGAGKLVMESIVETKASTLLDFLHGLRGELHVTLEEGTWATWLYDVLKPHVHEIVVYNPRRNALLKEGSKNDKVVARKLSELLRAGLLRAVYHGENGLRSLQELARSYEVVSKDTMRVMNRIKALYRSWGITCTGTQVYSRRHREQWLNKIIQAGVRRRAELFYQQLDGLQALRRTVRGELLDESRRHEAVKVLRQIPFIGPLRAAQLVALIQMPHRFRSKRQLWTYSRAIAFQNSVKRLVRKESSHPARLNFPRREPFEPSFCIALRAICLSTARLCGPLPNRVLS